MEAWTADGRRRSDVAVTFPGGARLAIEVQLGKITDSELLARREDYTRAGIALAWVWHQDMPIPRVLFRFGEPGWVFDPATDRMGLACGRAHPACSSGGTTARDRSPHWPPCPGDDIEVRWMPLAGVRLTEAGFLPSPEVAARLLEEAAEAAQRAQAEQAAASRSPPPQSSGQPPGPVTFRPPAHTRRHPGSRPSRTWHCASTRARPGHTRSVASTGARDASYLTGAQLQSSPVAHQIPGPDRWITWADLHPDDNI